MSRFQFYRVFRSLTGVTPKAYADAHRARRLRNALGCTETVTKAIDGAGYNSNSRFYDTASDVLGMTPTAFRAGGAGTAVRFAVDQCWLGSNLVAASEKGVCAIPVGSTATYTDAAALAAALAIDRGAPGIDNIAEPTRLVSIRKAQRDLGWDPGFRLQASAASG
jgi:AraC-like DNA-binding protein